VLILWANDVLQNFYKRMNWLNCKLVWRCGISLLAIVIVQSQKQDRRLLAGVPQAIATSIPDSSDEGVYRQIIDRAERQNLTQASMGEIVQAISKEFLGAEYKAGLLDRSTQETLVISLKQFDCLLFVETVLAIADNITLQKDNYQDFKNEVEDRRYWQGKMNGYCSRLHYFSDWIEDNQRRGNIVNVTQKLGGIDTVKKLNFMTTHRDSYSSLSKSDRNFKCISRVEDSLSTTFNYIPTQKIRRTYSQLKPGDIIGVATKIEGLDFTHTGFAYRQPNGNVGLIHASPAGKVVIAQDLQNYIKNVPQAAGIVVSRANKPKFKGVADLKYQTDK